MDFDKELKSLEDKVIHNPQEYLAEEILEDYFMAIRFEDYTVSDLDYIIDEDDWHWYWSSIRREIDGIKHSLSQALFDKDKKKLGWLKSLIKLQIEVDSKLLEINNHLTHSDLSSEEGKWLSPIMTGKGWNEASCLKVYNYLKKRELIHEKRPHSILDRFKENKIDHKLRWMLNQRELVNLFVILSSDQFDIVSTSKGSPSAFFRHFKWKSKSKNPIQSAIADLNSITRNSINKNSPLRDLYQLQ